MRHARRSCRAAGSVLSLAQQIELVIGPGPSSAFASDAERRAAWERHRAELLARSPAGRPPWAWQIYEAAAGIGGPGGE